MTDRYDEDSEPFQRLRKKREARERLRDGSQQREGKTSAA
jgi:hypothetical protein